MSGLILDSLASYRILEDTENSSDQSTNILAQQIYEVQTALIKLSRPLISLALDALKGTPIQLV